MQRQDLTILPRANLLIEALLDPAVLSPAIAVGAALLSGLGSLGLYRSGHLAAPPI